MHSRINEVKNHLLMVEAINALPDEVKNKTIVVCSGEASGIYYQKVISAIKTYHLEENFKFVGWTNTREILGISDFLVLPSTNEGFHLSVCEAFLMKVPVMRTKTGGFTDQKFCYPIDSNNPKDIEDIIIDIYTNGI
jgi:glycosyltransferase involved in cell wall biosynthesis